MGTFTPPFLRILRSSTALALLTLSATSASAMFGPQDSFPFQASKSLSSRAKQKHTKREVDAMSERASHIAFTGSSTDIQDVAIEVSPDGQVWKPIWDLNMETSDQSSQGVYVYDLKEDIGSKSPHLKPNIAPSLTSEGWKLLGNKGRGEKPLFTVPIEEGQLEIQGDGYNFYRTLPKDQLVPYDQQTLSFEVDVKSTTPGAYIEFWDGIKEIKSKTHSGSGKWERLNVSFKVDTAKAKFFNLYPAILPSSATEENPAVFIKDINLYPDLLPNIDFIAPTPTSVPEGWRLHDTLREARTPESPLSISSDSKGEVEIKGEGYNFYRSIPKAQLDFYDQQTLSFEADVKSTTPGAYIEFWDGVEEIKSKPHSGSGEWEKLSVSCKIDSAKAKFFNLYPAILSATGQENPSVSIKNVNFHQGERIDLGRSSEASIKENPHLKSNIAPSLDSKGWILYDFLKDNRDVQKPLFGVPTEEGQLEIQGDGYNFYRTLPKDQLVPYDQQTLSFEVDVKSTTPGAYIEFWDGIKEIKSKPHSGSGKWEKLNVSFKVDTAKAKFFNLYPAILLSSATEENPVVFIKDINLYPDLLQNIDFIAPTPTSVPEGWRLHDTLREGRTPESPLTISSDSKGEVEIKGEGYNFYRSIPKAQFAPYDQQTFLFEVEVKSTTPGAYIEFWDGIKEIKSDLHSGNGEWQKLSVSCKIDAAKAKFFNLYPAILSAMGQENPSVSIRNVSFHPDERIDLGEESEAPIKENPHIRFISGLSGYQASALDSEGSLSFKLPKDQMKPYFRYRLSVAHRSSEGSQIKVFDVGKDAFSLPEDLPPSNKFITTTFPLRSDLIMPMSLIYTEVGGVSKRRLNMNLSVDQPQPNMVIAPPSLTIDEEEMLKISGKIEKASQQITEVTLQIDPAQNALDLSTEMLDKRREEYNTTLALSKQRTVGSFVPTEKDRPIFKARQDAPKIRKDVESLTADVAAKKRNLDELTEQLRTLNSQLIEEQGKLERIQDKIKRRSSSPPKLIPSSVSTGSVMTQISGGNLIQNLRKSPSPPSSPSQRTGHSNAASSTPAKPQTLAEKMEAFRKAQPEEPVESDGEDNSDEWEDD